MFLASAIFLPFTLSVSPMAMSIATVRTAPAISPIVGVVEGAVWMPLSKCITPSLTCQLSKHAQNCPQNRLKPA